MCRGRELITFQAQPALGLGDRLSHQVELSQTYARWRKPDQEATIEMHTVKRQCRLNV